MTERQIRIAYNRLCSEALNRDDFHPEACQRCACPCQYGLTVLSSLDMEREPETGDPVFERVVNTNRHAIRKTFSRINGADITKL